MTAKARRLAMVDRVVNGAAKTPREVRRAAFDNRGVAEPLRPLLDKVAHHAWLVTDDDFAPVKATRTDDEIYEQVVCAAVGAATRKHDAALAALAEALEVPT